MPITIQQGKPFEAYYSNRPFYNFNQPVQNKELTKTINFSLFFKLTFYAFFGLILLMSLVSSFIFKMVETLRQKKSVGTAFGNELDEKEPKQIWVY